MAGGEKYSLVEGTEPMRPREKRRDEVVRDEQIEFEARA